MKLKITGAAVVNGKIHKKGSVVDFPRQIATHLLDNGLAEEHQEDPPRQQQQQRPQEPQQKQQQRPPESPQQ